MDEILAEYNRAVEDTREAGRRLSEMGNVLLIGNSFLVAAFAVILGQPIAKIVPYVLASVGIILCLLLLLGINSAWYHYRVLVRHVNRWSKELERSSRETSRSRFTYADTIPPSAVWRLPRLFTPGNIYRLWLPWLFLFMWIMLLVFAIE